MSFGGREGNLVRMRIRHRPIAERRALWEFSKWRPVIRVELNTNNEVLLYFVERNGQEYGSPRKQ